MDFDTSEVDVAIRISGGAWPGLCVERLGTAVVTAVCARSLASRIRSVAQLAKQPLIELHGQERRGWQHFLTRHRAAPPANVLKFRGYIETMRAAEQGLGVAFGVFPFTTEWVLSGRLAVPLTVREPLTAPINVLYRQADQNTRLFRELTSWLREQYAALPALPEGRVLRPRRHTQSPPERATRTTQAG